MESIILQIPLRIYLYVKPYVNNFKFPIHQKLYVAYGTGMFDSLLCQLQLAII